MSSLATLNSLSESGVSEFALHSYDGFRLVIVGSFDLCYFHDVEVVFSGVAHIDCPTRFNEPVFRDEGFCSNGRQFIIESDGRRFYIIAEEVAVNVAKVVYPATAPARPTDFIVSPTGAAHPAQIISREPGNA